MRKLSVRKIPKKDERGETGIGNMILFIAMILVSAIAAGLFLQTMSTLQQQAQETGEQAMIDVSTGLNIVTATGDRDLNGDDTLSSNIERIRLAVEINPGSKPIDMENVVIQLRSEDTMVELTYGGTTTADADDDEFAADEIRDPEDTWTASQHIVSSGSLIQVWIDPVDFSMDLPSSATLEIRLVPLHGSVCLLKTTTSSTYVNRYVDLK
jgi:archaellin